MKRIFKPSSKYCKGTRIEIVVKNWVWTKGKGLQVIYKDNIKCKSEYTLKKLLKYENVNEIK